MSGLIVCAGAQMTCTFGVAPATLLVPMAHKVLTDMPAANIMDNKPVVNVPTFGMCSAPTNPAVIAATSAALGVFTPVPCVPATFAPWIVGSSTTLIDYFPALDDSSKLMCTWCGVIQIASAGQAKVTV